MNFDCKTRQSKILPVCRPIITTYTMHAHLLSIIGNYDKTYPWVFSNYIQIYINKDYCKNRWGDFYFQFPYNLTPSDECDWIRTQKIDKNIIDRRYESLIDFITECLETGYYIRMTLDYSYLSISNLKCYHDILIYGIDIDKEVLYVADFFRNGHYSNEKLVFSEFYNAFYHCDIAKDKMNGLMYLYKVKDKCSYKFDIRNIENSIEMYLTKSIPEYWVMYNMDNKDNIGFGAQIYEILNCYLDQAISQDKGDIDIKPFYLMLDHKRIMFLRLKYLKELGYYKKLDENYNIHEMELIKCQAEKIINLILKYQLTRQVKIIDSIKDTLIKIRMKEYEVLKFYTNNL